MYKIQHTSIEYSNLSKMAKNVYSFSTMSFLNKEYLLALVQQLKKHIILSILAITSFELDKHRENPLKTAKNDKVTKTWPKYVPFEQRYYLTQF